MVVEKPPQDVISTDNLLSKQPTEEEILEQKTKILIRNLKLPCVYYTIDSCVYTKEIKAFLSGEWDGSQRMDDGEGAYNAVRYVATRDYYWIGVNMMTGESYSLKANVDYDGYKEIVPGNIPSQKFSLAVSRIDGEIEQWSLYEKLDAWKINQVASGKETIENIIPVSTEDSAKDAMQVYVDTVDISGQQHMYSLMPNGVVNRLL